MIDTREWDWDETDTARRQLEDDLVQIGIDHGMADSRAIAHYQATGCTYEDQAGNQHSFEFAPIGCDAQFPAELP